MRTYRLSWTVIVAIVMLAVLSDAKADAAPRLPTAMAAVGDSITRAFDSGAFGDDPMSSWSTGTAPALQSHYQRLLQRGAPLSGHERNDAVTGARMADLYKEMAVVTTQHVDYVTVLAGANDVCADSESAMTSVAAFAIQFRVAMLLLRAGSPEALVYVVSIPDIYNLWSVMKDDGNARLVWGVFGICQSMLANPLSIAPADVARRARVRQRLIDFNAALRRICRQEFAATCRDDHGAAFLTRFGAADVSTLDYFHPSVAGQTKLAAVTWAAGYWGDHADR